MQLVPGESARALFTFGARHLPRLLAAHWVVYALIAIAGGGFAMLTATEDHYRVGSIESLSILPALAASLRLARPEFRMTLSQALTVVAIWIIELGVFLFAALVALPVMYALMRVSPALSTTFVACIIALGFWLVVKLSLTPSFYVLQPDRSIVDAFRRSWSTVRGGTWWNLFCAAFGASLLTGIPAGIAAAAVVSALHFQNRPLIFAVSIVASGAIVVANVWAQAMFMALAIRRMEEPAIA